MFERTKFLLEVVSVYLLFLLLLPFFVVIILIEPIEDWYLSKRLGK